MGPDVPFPTEIVYVPVCNPAVLKFTVAKFVFDAPVEQRLPTAEETGTFPEGPVIVKFEPFVEIDEQRTGSEKLTLNELARHA